MTNSKAIEKAFKDGMAVQRIADETFYYKRKPFIYEIGLALGVVISILGIFPVAKLAEGGSLENAFYGVLVLVSGLFGAVLATIAETRWERTRDEARQQNYEKVKSNLLDNSLKTLSHIDSSS